MSRVRLFFITFVCLIVGLSAQGVLARAQAVEGEIYQSFTVDVDEDGSFEKVVLIAYNVHRDMESHLKRSSYYGQIALLDKEGFQLWAGPKVPIANEVDQVVSDYKLANQPLCFGQTTKTVSDIRAVFKDETGLKVVTGVKKTSAPVSSFSLLAWDADNFVVENRNVRLLESKTNPGVFQWSSKVPAYVGNENQYWAHSLAHTDVDGVFQITPMVLSRNHNTTIKKAPVFVSYKDGSFVPAPCRQCGSFYPDYFVNLPTVNSLQIGIVSDEYLLNVDKDSKEEYISLVPYKNDGQKVLKQILVFDHDGKLLWEGPKPDSSTDRLYVAWAPWGFQHIDAICDLDNDSHVELVMSTFIEKDGLYSQQFSVYKWVDNQFVEIMTNQELSEAEMGEGRYFWFDKDPKNPVYYGEFSTNTQGTEDSIVLSLMSIKDHPNLVVGNIHDWYRLLTASDTGFKGAECPNCNAKYPVEITNYTTSAKYW